MKRASLALAALVASTVALPQQMTQRTPAQRHTSTASQEQRAPRMSETDKLILLGDCMRQMQAAHPRVPEKDAKAYCDKRVKSYSFPHN